jgi:hypothetical protein
MSHYNVIFEGSISDGYKVKEVKGNLAVLFKVNEEKIDHLFSKQRVVLKKELDHDSAVKYQKALLKAGAMCKVKAVPLPDGSLPVETAAPLCKIPQIPEKVIPPPLPNQLPGDMIDRGKQTVSEQIVKTPSKTKLGKGVGDIIAGVVLIAIGFAFGGSIFMGNPGWLDYIFDGFGIFWIGSGIYKMIR